METPRLNYVVACWAGERRFMHPAMKHDRTTFLKMHLRQLERLKHDIARVTVVVNAAPDDQLSKRFDSFVDEIDGTRLRRATISVIRRANIGMSYGAWDAAFVRDGDAFSHYVWIEDDYVFVHDRFDLEMLEMMRVSGCDYLCGVANDGYGHERHAAISNGMVNSEILTRVRNKYGELPHAKSSLYRDNETVGQVGMSRAIIDVGGKLSDFVEFGWSVPFSHLGGVHMYGDPKGPRMIAPVEQLLSNK